MLTRFHILLTENTRAYYLRSKVGYLQYSRLWHPENIMLLLLGYCAEPTYGNRQFQKLLPNSHRKVGLRCIGLSTDTQYKYIRYNIVHTVGHYTSNIGYLIILLQSKTLLNFIQRNHVRV